ncbi:MAG: GtrA family protein [Pseudomonadota bacterium]
MRYLKAPKDFKRFCISGCVGFIVDAGLLQLGIGLGFGAIESRIFSLAVALTVTWVLHRNYTFKALAQEPMSQYGKFIIVGLSGAALNFLIFTGILISQPPITPFIALVIASAIALIANYLGSRYFAFSS